ncbi:hypothetical protein GQ457_04G024300 [Hibiscus cannabinus]
MQAYHREALIGVFHAMRLVFREVAPIFTKVSLNFLASTYRISKSGRWIVLDSRYVVLLHTIHILNGGDRRYSAGAPSPEWFRFKGEWRGLEPPTSPLFVVMMAKAW